MFLDKIIILTILLIFINSIWLYFFDNVSKLFNIYDFPDYKRKNSQKTSASFRWGNYFSLTF